MPICKDSDWEKFFQRHLTSTFLPKDVISIILIYVQPTIEDKFELCMHKVGHMTLPVFPGTGWTFSISFDAPDTSRVGYYVFRVISCIWFRDPAAPHPHLVKHADLFDVTKQYHMLLGCHMTQGEWDQTFGQRIEEKTSMFFRDLALLRPVKNKTNEDQLQQKKKRKT